MFLPVVVTLSQEEHLLCLTHKMLQIKLSKLSRVAQTIEAPRSLRGEISHW